MTQTFHQDGLLFSTLLEWNEGLDEQQVHVSRAQLGASNLLRGLGFYQVSWASSPALPK